ncbi:hypothetical protein D1BOALGB6SA_9719 [Olavius sp. associated proteobacterium Delta 1]|nr:hypothetical protein D1BOALGB6SA_9719 [Olavius sp. associated proteobacterium Delta 1]
MTFLSRLYGGERISFKLGKNPIFLSRLYGGELALLAVRCL